MCVGGGRPSLVVTQLSIMEIYVFFKVSKSPPQKIQVQGRLKGGAARKEDNDAIVSPPPLGSWWEVWQEWENAPLLWDPLSSPFVLGSRIDGSPDSDRFVVSHSR